MAKDQNLTTMEEYKLARQIAYLQKRLRRAQDILRGQPLTTVRFQDASITNAKILALAAEKITTGTLSIGQMILVNDGTNDRVMITRNQVRISKEGVDVKQTITEENKKDFVMLSDEESHKLMWADFIIAGSVNHGIGRVPFHFAFETDSDSSPTYFEAINTTQATPTQILGLPNPSYVIVFNEGGDP